MDDVPIRVADIVGPGVFGVWRPEIVVPPWVLKFPSRARKWILRHEAQHVAARDPLLVEVAALAAILVPWNLLLW